MYRRPELQVVSLSFLDLLCCAFGAVILLVLLLIPGKGSRSEVTEKLTSVARGKILFDSATAYECVLVSVESDNNVASPALPLLSFHQSGDHCRIRFTPVDPKSESQGTTVIGVDWEVFVRGERSLEAETIWAVIHNGIPAPPTYGKYKIYGK